MNQRDMKRPLLLFTGGLDSTYMLTGQLEQNEVDVFYCVSPNITPEKQIKEKEQRAKIIKWANQHCRFKVRNDIIVETNNSHIAGFDKLAQPAMWLYAALGAYSEETSAIWIGYVNGDDVCQFVDKLKTAWDNLSHISRQHQVPLEFPLLQYRKEYLMKNMPKELIDLTWSCEMPVRKSVRGKDKIVKCGQCVPCITRETVEFKFNRMNELNNTARNA